ncbi:MAG: ferritin-like domain-containing protein [Deltaproteobacteria bacterium]|nr:ferritin-like domain-containing protein [Deltaproteobacteria bacterium]
MLSGFGFKQVYNLTGGIKAWNGVVAEGPVEMNLDLISGAEGPLDVLKLAYGMEQNLALFYREVEKGSSDNDLIKLLHTLASIEDRHKEFIYNLYKSEELAALSLTDFEASVKIEIMEGGIKLEDFVTRNQRFLQSASDILDLSMMLETQALDLYLRLAHRSTNEQARSTFNRIADEEKSHLTALSKLRDQKLSSS